MTSKSPRFTADHIIRLLKRKGFKLDRQSGSHRIFINESGIRVTVPYHKGKIIHPKIINQRLRDADIEPDDLD